MTTMKDLLEKAITGVIKQGKPSMSKFGGCGYRGSNGTKCAVGMLIDEGFYHEDLEGSTVKNRQVILAVQETNGVTLSEDDVAILDKLQNCHDTASRYPDTFSAKFKSEVTGCVLLGKLPRYCLDFL